MIRDDRTPAVASSALTVLAAVLLLTPALATIPGGGSAEPAAGAAPDETVPDDEDHDVRIVRDQHGVPHAYGETDEDVAYGAGYALAEDRLWQMHLFRLIGEGRLSEFLGPAVVGTDQGIRTLTYTEEERQERFETYPKDIKSMMEAFTEGVNQRLDEVRQDPSQVPFEFAEYGMWPIEDWEVTDSVALQDVLILSFGAGGGNEVEHAALYQDLRDRYDRETAEAIFADLVPTVDNASPVTIPRGEPYEQQPTFGRDAESEDRRQLTEDARLDGAPYGPTSGVPDLTDNVPVDEEGPALGTPAQADLLEDPHEHLDDMEEVDRARQLLERVFSFGSNAQVVGPEVSETGNAMQTAGPQVGHLLPQWLADVGLHAEEGQLDATGMTFAGAGPAVLIGMGDGYAWTTTTGSSDLTDSYVLELHPDDPERYRYDGAWREMDCRTETYTFRGVPFEEQRICRSQHGPVVSVDEDADEAVAIRMGWYDREGQTVEGFFEFNGADDIEDYATSANKLASNHNMFYTDDQGNIGYWHPGNFPDRKDGVDIRLPQDGTGGSEWEGLIGVQDTPHSINPERGWIANWNNMPAEDWERERAWGARDNANSLYQALDPDNEAPPDPHGGLVNPDRGVDFHDLDANLRYGAFKHHETTWYREALPDTADLDDPQAEAALDVVEGWNGHLTDRDDDGLYDSAGNTIVDAWVDEMDERAFDDDLDDLAGWADEGDLLWHVVVGDERFQVEHGWLEGEDPQVFATRAFEAAVDDLDERFDAGDPADWREEVETEHYQRLNADLAADLAQSTLGVDNSEDSGLPGDVPDHIEMDRGTYNHIVAYREPPTEGPTTPGDLEDADELPPLGESERKAGSVIPPGQSGHIDLTGQEADHYEDQLELYVDWDYKPMPMTLEEARSLAEEETTLTR